MEARTSLIDTGDSRESAPDATAMMRARVQCSGSLGPAQHCLVISATGYGVKDSEDTIGAY